MNNIKKLYYGAAYYDEYLPYDRLQADMEMMKKAGINLIRIAESTWSAWEPKDGEFDFSHLHRMRFRHGWHASIRIFWRIPIMAGSDTAIAKIWISHIPGICSTHSGSSAVS